MNTEIKEHDPLMIFAMQLANAAELAATLNLTIDCGGSYISIHEWTGTSIGNNDPMKSVYADTNIGTIIGWLDGVVYERNRIRKLYGIR